jgi:hypothetical protein
MKYWWIALLLIIVAYVLGYVNGCNSVHCPEIKAQEKPKEIHPIHTDPVVVVPPKDSLVVLKRKFVAKNHIKPTSNPDIPFEPPSEGTICDELLREYYSIHFNHSTYQDSAMVINITDSVSENEIKYRHVDYVRLGMLAPVAIKQSFALSAGVSVNTLLGPGIGGDIEWKRLRAGLSWYPLKAAYTGGVGYVLFRK